MLDLHEPTACTNAPYGMRVRDNSMAPRIRRGQVLLVEPHRPCVQGEEVLITLLDGRKMIRELVAEDPGAVTVMPVNGAEWQSINRSMVCHMHPVTGIVAASAWRGAVSNEL